MKRFASKPEQNPNAAENELPESAADEGGYEVYKRQKKNNLKVTLFYTAAFIASVILKVVSTLIFRGSAVDETLWTWVTAGLILLPFALIGLDALFTAATRKMLNSTDVAEINRAYRENRRQVREDYRSAFSGVRAVRRSYAARAAWLIFSGAAVSFISGVFMPDRIMFVLGLFAGAYMMLCGAASLPAFVRSKETGVANEPVSEEEYPYVYKMARRAAAEAGCVKDIRITFSSDYNAAIAEQGKTVLLLIGAPLMRVLSEKEFYVILLHEFAHCSEGFFEEVRKEDRLFNRMADGEHGVNVPEVYFTVLRRVYAFRYIYFTMCVQPVIEAAADHTAIRGSEPELFASAQIKSSYSVPLEWEKYGYDNDDCEYAWSGESFPDDYPAHEAEGILKAAAGRSDIWLENFGREIISNNATHPTLKMRLEAAGVEKMEVREYESSEEYLAEMRKGLGYAGRKTKEFIEPDFASLKKAYYGDPMKTVGEWEEAGRPVDPVKYGDVVDSLRLLGRATDAEQLCDRAIEELPEQAAAKAIYIKGCALMSRYDPAGIETVYRAIDLNENYADEGYRIVIEFCLMTGRQEEADEARNRGIAYDQKNLDVYSKLYRLDKGDELRAETLPEGVLEKDLQNILRAGDGSISRVYLVRKEVADKYASHYVIQFKDGTDDEKKGETLHSIFMYLDTVSDWQYSLEEYGEAANAGLEKIEGALVWEDGASAGD